MADCKVCSICGSVKREAPYGRVCDGCASRRAREREGRVKAMNMMLRELAKLDPCACGSSRRQSSSGRMVCDTCNRARANEYRQKNIELVREKDRIREKLKPREKRLESRRKWAEANVELDKCRRRETAKRLYHANQPKYLARAKNYQREHRQELIEKQRHQRERLEDVYVRTVLRLSASDAPPELIEIKREQLSLRRLMKQFQQEITNQQEKSNGN